MVHRRGVLAQPNRERPHEIGITSPGFPHVQGDFARCADLEDLGFGIHDKGAIRDHRLAQGPA
jgi:hypothetical protein